VPEPLPIAFGRGWLLDLFLNNKTPKNGTSCRAQPKHLARIVERLDYFPTRDASAARTTDEHDVPFLLFGNKSIPEKGIN